MGNYKIQTQTNVMFNEAVDLFNKIGYKGYLGGGISYRYLYAREKDMLLIGSDDYKDFVESKSEEISFRNLRTKVYSSCDPLQKEYLQELEDGTYKLVVMSDVVDGHHGLIPVPEGADIAISLLFDGSPSFYRNDFKEVFGCSSKCWTATSHTNENLAIWRSCKVLWQRVEYDPDDINLAVGADLDAIGKKLGCNGRLPWWSDDEYRKQLLIVNGTGLRHIGFECVVLDKDEKLSASDHVKLLTGGVGFSLENNYVNAFDMQVGGNHYKDLAIQPMEYALKNKLDYAQANVVKYVTRHALKNGKEDLLKAKHNIDLMIEHYYGEEK